MMSYDTIGYESCCGIAYRRFSCLWPRSCFIDVSLTLYIEYK